MSIYTKILCPKCNADWQYGWGSPPRLLAFIKSKVVTYIKCFSCEMCWSKADAVTYIEDMTKDGI